VLRREATGGAALIKDESVQSWLDSLASSSATPGGGSATAIMGAMAAALVSMVCRLTIENSTSAALRDEMNGVLQRAEAARAQLTWLIEEDVKAFDAVMAAYALPRATAEQQAARSPAIQAALHQATLAPLACARASAEVLALAAIIVERGHLNAVGESGAAAQAAHAALRAAALNVSINLGSIKEQAFVDGQLAELEQIVRQYGSLDAHINELLAKRLN
jgi:formiminotetrahydrofolate cyclodeaminase